MAWSLKQQGWVGDLHGASHCKDDEKGTHQTEELHSVRQGKAQNSLGEELLLQRRGPGIASDQAASPEPATPTVAAPMPVTLAAASVSQEKALVWYSCLATWSGTLLWEGCSGEVSGLLSQEGGRQSLMGPLVEEWIGAGGMRTALAGCVFSVSWLLLFCMMLV